MELIGIFSIFSNTIQFKYNSDIQSYYFIVDQYEIIILIYTKTIFHSHIYSKTSNVYTYPDMLNFNKFDLYIIKIIE